MNECPFCLENGLLKTNIFHEDEQWYVTDSKDDINNAVLAIPKRHVETPFELNTNEWQSLQPLIDRMKQLVDEREQPQGYTIGWNVGTTAGQTVMHAHLHVLARYDNEPLAGKGIRYFFRQDDNRRT